MNPNTGEVGSFSTAEEARAAGFTVPVHSGLGSRGMLGVAAALAALGFSQFEGGAEVVRRVVQRERSSSIMGSYHAPHERSVLTRQARRRLQLAGARESEINARART